MTLNTGNIKYTTLKAANIFDSLSKRYGRRGESKGRTTNRPAGRRPGLHGSPRAYYIYVPIFFAGSKVPAQIIYLRLHYKTDYCAMQAPNTVKENSSAAMVPVILPVSWEVTIFHARPFWDPCRINFPSMISTFSMGDVFIFRLLALPTNNLSLKFIFINCGKSKLSGSPFIQDVPGEHSTTSTTEHISGFEPSRSWAIAEKGEIIIVKIEIKIILIMSASLIRIRAMETIKSTT